MTVRRRPVNGRFLVTAPARGGLLRQLDRGVSRRGAGLGDNNASDNGTMYEYTTVSGGNRYDTDISARSRQRQMYARGYLNTVSNEQHY
jgi:hypothetical protein